MLYLSHSVTPVLPLSYGLPVTILSAWESVVILLRKGRNLQVLVDKYTRSWSLVRGRFDTSVWVS